MDAIRPTDDDVKWARAFVERVQETQPTVEQIVEALACERASVRYEEWFRCTMRAHPTAAGKTDE